MSHLDTCFAAVGGLSAGFAAAAPLLFWQRRLLHERRRALAGSQRDRSHWLRAAMHSETTDLPNRRALRTHLEATFTLGEPLGLVLIDLDRFKRINDTHGHEHGNDVLYEVGRRLAALGPLVAVAAHLSGDEFALVVHGDQADVEAAAQAAHQRISTRPYDLLGQQVTVTASVGYAVAEPGMRPCDLLRAADQAMYLAKRAQSGVCAHDPGRRTPPDPVTRYRDLR